MSIFVDTSAFLAVIIAEDKYHSRASSAWRDMIQRDIMLVTSNYVIVETLSLLQRRASPLTMHHFVEDILPAINIEWVDWTLHTAGVNSVLMASSNGPSFVDCVSFALMRRLAIASAFTFDRHFAQQGFTVIEGISTANN